MYVTVFFFFFFFFFLLFFLHHWGHMLLVTGIFYTCIISTVFVKHTTIAVMLRSLDGLKGPE